MSQNVVFFVASIRANDLIALKELIEANKVSPVIDRRYTLSEVPEAIRYLNEGHARGKVVIAVEHNSNTVVGVNVPRREQLAGAGEHT